MFKTQPATVSLNRANLLQGRWSGLVAILALIGLWWLAALMVQANLMRGEIFLPSPLQVIEAIPRLSVSAGASTPQTLSNGLWVIAENTGSSALTLVGGLTIGGGLGIGLGLAFGWSATLRLVLEGPFLLIRVIPLFALLPLFLSWFGGTRTGAVSFVAFAVFSMLFVNTLEAIRNVSPIASRPNVTTGGSKMSSARTLDCTRWRTVSRNTAASNQ